MILGSLYLGRPVLTSRSRRRLCSFWSPLALEPQSGCSASRPATPAAYPRDVVSVLIVDFKNDTGDRAFDGTIQEMLASSIEDSSFLVFHPRPPASRQPLDESAGRALAVREGITAMVSGNVALTQPGYVISATIIDPALGKILARVSANALARVNVVDAAESVAREIRIRLGDSAVLLNTEASPAEVHSKRGET